MTNTVALYESRSRGDRLGLPQTASAFLAAFVVLSLSACSFMLPSLGNTLRDELRASEQRREATVDFSETFPSSWTQLTIVCRGATERELNKALGYEWTDAPNLNSPAFLSMIVLSNTGGVIDHFNFGQNDFEEDLYVNPCPPGTADEIDNFTIAVVEVADSNVNFIYQPAAPGDHWYVSESEFARLRSDD